MELFSCPECGYQNSKGSVSCKRCLLIFEKYEKKTLNSVSTVKGSKNLEDQWQSILGDYENIEKHEKIIQDAVKEKSLPFVSQQYKKMIDLNNHDEIAKKMIDKIINVATLTYVPPFRKEPPKNTRWLTKLILFSFLFLVAVMILNILMKK